MLLYINGILQLKSLLSYFVIKKTKHKKKIISQLSIILVKIFFIKPDKQRVEYYSMIK